MSRKTGRPQNSENWEIRLCDMRSRWVKVSTFTICEFSSDAKNTVESTAASGHSELVRKLDEIKRDKQQSLRKTDSSGNFSCAHAQTRKSLSRRHLVSIRLIFHPIRSDKCQIWLRFSSFSFRSARLLASRFGLFPARSKDPWTLPQKQGSKNNVGWNLVR